MSHWAWIPSWTWNSSLDQAWNSELLKKTNKNFEKAVVSFAEKCWYVQKGTKTGTKDVLEKKED